MSNVILDTQSFVMQMLRTAINDNLHNVGVYIAVPDRATMPYISVVSITIKDTLSMIQKIANIDFGIDIFSINESNAEIIDIVYIIQQCAIMCDSKMDCHFNNLNNKQMSQSKNTKINIHINNFTISRIVQQSCWHAHCVINACSSINDV